MFLEITVKSLGDLIDAVTPAEPDPKSGRLRDAGVFRGVTRLESGLHTALDRLGSPRTQPFGKAHLESHLFRNFVRYSRSHLPFQPTNLWELLVIAQHHGLPTRLLDWTYSPLVAAHFATLSEEPDFDCAIWRLDWKRVHRHFRFPTLAFTVEDLDRALRDRGIQSLWDLFEARESTEPFVCMLEPPALDSRIVAQSATFTFSSDKTVSLDTLLENAGLQGLLTRFRIPAASIGRMRDQLDLCSLDERRLFPGLDGLAAQLRRYYWTSPREGPPAGRL